MTEERNAPLPGPQVWGSAPAETPVPIPGVPRPIPGAPMPSPVPPGFPPPYPPPTSSSSGFPPVPGVPQKKKRKTWLWVLLGAFLLFAMLIVGCSVVVVRAVKGPADAANAFVAALYDKPADAVAKTCDRAGIDLAKLEQIRAAFVNEGWRGRKNLQSVNMQSSNGTSTARVSGTITVDRAVPITFELAKLDGKWCIDRVAWGSEAANAQTTTQTTTPS